MTTPQPTRAQRRQQRRAVAVMAGLVTFVLAWWVLGHGLPSFGSTEGWGSLVVAVFLGLFALGVGLALQDPHEIDPDQEERGVL